MHRHDPNDAAALAQAIADEETNAQRLEAEHAESKARIAALRADLAAIAASPSPTTPEPPPLTSAGKVKLFRELFRGRSDIYPTRFVSKKTGKAGYAPACSNKFVAGLCELPKVKCGDCTH